MNFINCVKSCFSQSPHEEVPYIIPDIKPTWKNTIPFVAPITQGVVIKVYDGDTITIASKLPYEASPLYRFSVRLNRIDTAEIKSKNKAEKEMAKIAKERLSNIIMNKVVLLKNVKTEKYGRVLADVYHNNTCMNDWMLENKLAVEYDGGKKKNVDWNKILMDIH